MSGGHFDYSQYHITTIADSIESIVRNNTHPDEDGYIYNFSEETIKEFEKAVEILKLAGVYAQRIDWLLSGDDGEESFHERLNEELSKL